MRQEQAGPRRAPCRITVLCDNESADPGCGCEWGLALAVELDQGGLWLWDAGQTDLFLRNARHLGIDAGQASGLALSHGHYDHTGGLGALCAATAFRGPIYAHPACARRRYAQEHGRPKPIGPPLPLPDFTLAGPLTVLAPGLTLLTDIPRAPGRFQAVQGFSLDPSGTEPDLVPDDAFLVLDSASGPVVILGCCHSGLANSLACARQRLGLDRVFAVLGGLHLFKAGPEALEETAGALEEFGVRRLLAGHCTGPDRLARLKRRLPDRQVLPLAAGQTWFF
ncbi:MAG: MBL fold metallo-hydrolase [Proteobacteria bacterium]|nr:MBL fold metallo-hydrolase [Pseudomonadota bacterium]MBU1594419.1 MBL fold metallo-hydrolase [Pseudomonadota bacterium]